MSRAIKFRAWDKENEEYYYDVEHTYDFFCSGRGCYAESFGEVLNQPDRFIVEQFTGLLDRNGREIYEGDIVFFFTEHFDKATGGFDGEDEHNAIVEWFDNGFAFMDKVPYDPNIECEVIGNIHENKELLGGEE